MVSSLLWELLRCRQQRGSREVPRHFFHVNIALDANPAVDRCLFALIHTGGLADGEGLFFSVLPGDVFVLEVASERIKDNNSVDSELKKDGNTPTLTTAQAPPPAPATTPPQPDHEWKAVFPWLHSLAAGVSTSSSSAEWCDTVVAEKTLQHFLLQRSMSGVNEMRKVASVAAMVREDEMVEVDANTGWREWARNWFKNNFKPNEADERTDGQWCQIKPFLHNLEKLLGAPLRTTSNTADTTSGSSTSTASNSSFNALSPPQLQSLTLLSACVRYLHEQLDFVFQHFTVQRPGTTVETYKDALRAPFLTCKALIITPPQWDTDLTIPMSGNMLFFRQPPLSVGRRGEPVEASMVFFTKAAADHFSKIVTKEGVQLIHRVYLEDTDSTLLDKLVSMLNTCRWTTEPIGMHQAQTTMQHYKCSLTLGHVLKMIVLCIRGHCRVPTVLEGPTGCGKTFLVHFLTSPPPAETVHPGCSPGHHRWGIDSRHGPRSGEE